MSVALALTVAGAARLSMQDADVQTVWRRAFANYAACVVERRRNEVVAMLQQPYDDRMSKASRTLNTAACPIASDGAVFEFRIVEKYDGLGWRGALYQALLRRDAKDQAVDPRTAVPGDEAFPIGRSWPGSPAGEYSALIERGRCLIERDPAAAKALVVSEVTSAEESEAMRKLYPARGKCGAMPREVNIIRGVLAELLYRATFPTPASYMVTN